MVWCWPKRLLYEQSIARTQNEAIPWQVMYAMRNRVSHGYDKLDFEMVWKTICNDLPDLHKLVKAVSSEAKG